MKLMTMTLAGMITIKGTDTILSSGELLPGGFMASEVEY